MCSQLVTGITLEEAIRQISYLRHHEQHFYALKLNKKYRFPDRLFNRRLCPKISARHRTGGCGYRITSLLQGKLQLEQWTSQPRPQAFPCFLTLHAKKSGRPGRFCDVICHDFCHSSLSPPTRPRNHVHVASYGSRDSGKSSLVPRPLPGDEAMANRSYQENCQQK